MMDVLLQPEMEMVARGLEKLLKVEQREYLMNMLVGICSEESHRTAAEALGLVCLHFVSLNLVSRKCSMNRKFYLSAYL